MNSRLVNPCLNVLLTALALVGCSESSIGQGAAGQGTVTKANVERGAPAPAAPIDLKFQAPLQAPAGQALTIEADITTPVKNGSLEVKLTAQQGVTLLEDPFARFDLSSAVQPLPVKLKLLPGAERQRYVVLVVTIETDSVVPLVRSFRIALPDDNEVHESPAVPAKDGLKILPSTPR